MRKTTKLIESGYHGLQDYRHIRYYFYVFYVFLRFFQNQKSRDVFCRVSYVFSNYDLQTVVTLWLTPATDTAAAAAAAAGEEDEDGDETLVTVE